MRTKEITGYKFDELGESAKEKAREWYREGNLDYDWWDHIYEDAATIADILGIDLRRKPVKLMNGETRHDPAIWFTGFYSQGDGACYEGHYRYQRGCSKAIRKHAPKDAELHRIADELTAIQKKYGYGLAASIRHSDRYCHSRTMTINVDRRDCLPFNNEDGEAVEELLRDFAVWIYQQLEREYDYLMSNEAVDEQITANEYEFEEDGTIA